MFHAHKACENVFAPLPNAYKPCLFLCYFGSKVDAYPQNFMTQPSKTNNKTRFRWDYTHLPEKTPSHTSYSSVLYMHNYLTHNSF